MIKKKIKIFYKKLVQLFFKIIYGKILIPKNVNNLLKKEKIDHKIFRSFKNNHYNFKNNINKTSIS